MVLVTTVGSESDIVTVAVMVRVTGGGGTPGTVTVDVSESPWTGTTEYGVRLCSMRALSTSSGEIGRECVSSARMAVATRTAPFPIRMVAMRSSVSRRLLGR